jgi:hypothetical protein
LGYIRPMFAATQILALIPAKLLGALLLALPAQK